MKKIASIFILILLIINPFIVEFSKSFFVNGKILRGKNTFAFSPDEMELKDDAFHGTKTFCYTEWWYFDAVFDNNYSAQMNVRVVNMLIYGNVFKRLDIYKDGVIISHNKESYLMKKFSASKEVPSVYLNDFPVINGFIDNVTGNWIYNLSFQFDEASANLRFTGCTKGWKGQLRGNEWWGVALPCAKTSGKLTIKNETINVTGIGYHDHNWDIAATAGVNFGWYWGKIHSTNYTITWAKVMRTRINGDLILVVNKNQDEYLNLEPTQIQFITEKFSLENMHLIPHSFTIIANNDNVSMNVKIDVINIHHSRFFGVLNYWRYHVKCIGSITVDSHTENIDSYQVAEFLRLR